MLMKSMEKKLKQCENCTARIVWDVAILDNLIESAKYEQEKLIKDLLQAHIPDLKAYYRGRVDQINLFIGYVYGLKAARELKVQCPALDTPPLIHLNPQTLKEWLNYENEITKEAKTSSGQGL